MGTLNKKRRGKLAKEFNNRCAYCGKPLGHVFHIDHVIPKSLGGTGTLKNFLPSCERCNMLKLEYDPRILKKKLGLDFFLYESLGVKKGEEKYRDENGCISIRQVDIYEWWDNQNEKMRHLCSRIFKQCKG